MSKKAFIRTVEAVIAIVLVLIFAYAVTPKTKIAADVAPYNVEVAQKTILNEILTKPTIRDNVLSLNLEPAEQSEVCSVNSDIGNEPVNVVEEQIYNISVYYVPPGYEFAFRICLKTTCVLDSTGAMESLSKKSIFMDDAILSASAGLKIVRLWIWKK